jgi:hypothetical protein
VLVLLIGLGSEWIYPLIVQASDVLSDPSLYTKAVLGVSE